MRDAAGPENHPPTLLHVFPRFDIGGAQVRFASVVNHFGRRYRHVIVAMFGAAGEGAARERLDPALDLGFPEVAVRHGRTLGNIVPFYRMLRALRPAVMVTHNWGSMDFVLANQAARIRHIHIEDGFGPEERDRQLPRRVLIRRFALRRSTVVLPSRTLERIAARVWLLPRAGLRYIPNGIDLARFAVASAARFPGVGPIIGTVAALRPEKRLDRLLHAFAAIAEPARLVIVGEGPERAALERLAADLGIAGRVAFTGHEADPAPLYAAFDIFALSSDTEQMPLSLIEAMAAGLPVAATDVGDVRVMVAPENTAFVGPRDAEALGRALGQLVADPDRCAHLGAANRAKAAREYDQRTMFAAYGALFDGTDDDTAAPATGPAYQARNE